MGTVNDDFNSGRSAEGLSRRRLRGKGLHSPKARAVSPEGGSPKRNRGRRSSTQGDPAGPATTVTPVGRWAILALNGSARTGRLGRRWWAPRSADREKEVRWGPRKPGEPPRVGFRTGRSPALRPFRRLLTAVSTVGAAGGDRPTTFQTAGGPVWRKASGEPERDFARFGPPTGTRRAHSLIERWVRAV